MDIILGVWNVFHMSERLCQENIESSSFLFQIKPSVKLNEINSKIPKIQNIQRSKKIQNAKKV